MIQRNKMIGFFFILFSLPAMVLAQNNRAPAVENILQKGFPVQLEALSLATESLLNEYENKQNIASLIFYSYGMLRLANHYKAVNDYVRASEFAKLGFFYLDEAVDSHEEDMRIRYLRARVDAYLAADLGRCVVTLADTQTLLEHSEQFDSNAMAHINYMRYRALHSCGEMVQADALLSDMQQGSPEQLTLLAHGTEGTPEWDVNEVTQVIMPLVKGE